MLWKVVSVENCVACHVHSQGIMLHVNSRETTFEHQRVPAARFNNIFLKLFDRYATYCYLQVDHKSFLASGAFFLGREATERATISQVINSRHS